MYRVVVRMLRWISGVPGEQPAGRLAVVCDELLQVEADDLAVEHG